MKNSEKQLNATRDSLKRVHDFDVHSLPRVERLGQDYNFLDAVPHAETIVGLFRQFPLQYLDDLPDNHLNAIKATADATFNVFDQIQKFDPKQTEAYNTRQNLITSVSNQYEPVFNAISPLIAYAGARQRDFSLIETQARAVIQAAKDDADKTMQEMKAQQEDGKKILEDIRAIAAEQGVSQQSIYFKTESEKLEQTAENWKLATVVLAAVMVIYVAAAAFLHKWSALAPSNTFESIQLTASKVLIFAVIAFMLALAARNFLASKHNAIINRHRYNALLTFKALVDAAITPENRDIVLNHAAACIYAPQETGYSKGGSERSEIVPSIIQTLPKISSGAASHA